MLFNRQTTLSETGFYTRVQQLDLSFGVKLRYKTLVLRKDKVTRCVGSLVPWFVC